MLPRLGRFILAPAISRAALARSGARLGDCGAEPEEVPAPTHGEARTFAGATPSTSFRRQPEAPDARTRRHPGFHWNGELLRRSGALAPRSARHDPCDHVRRPRGELRTAATRSVSAPASTATIRGRAEESFQWAWEPTPALPASAPIHEPQGRCLEDIAGTIPSATFAT